MTAGRLKPLFTWRSAITESGLPPTVRHVALTLSLHMSERGDSCFPSIALLRDETGLSKPTVLRALAALEDAGYLSVRRSQGGRGHSNRYCAVIPSNPQTVKLCAPFEAEKGSTGETLSGGNGQSVSHKRSHTLTRGRQEDVPREIDIGESTRSGRVALAGYFAQHPERRGP